jgi:hypothetical protein
MPVFRSLLGLGHQGLHYRGEQEDTDCENE